MQSFSDHFGRQAADYARFRPHYPPELFDFLYERCSNFELAWDCGTGNGQVAVALGRRFQRVVATDASAAQLEHARQAPNVEYRFARAEESGLPESSVDLLTAAAAVHWFDLKAFHNEVRRVMRPGGLVAFWTYAPRVVAPEPIPKLVDEFTLQTVGKDWPPGFELAYDEYRHLPLPCRDQLDCPNFDLNLDWGPDELLGWMTTWSAVQRYRSRTGSDPLPRFASELRQQWPQGHRGVRLPMVMRAGLADLVV